MTIRWGNSSAVFKRAIKIKTESFDFHPADDDESYATQGKFPMIYCTTQCYATISTEFPPHFDSIIESFQFSPEDFPSQTLVTNSTLEILRGERDNLFMFRVVYRATEFIVENSNFNLFWYFIVEPCDLTNEPSLYVNGKSPHGYPICWTSSEFSRTNFPSNTRSWLCYGVIKLNTQLRRGSNSARETVVESHFYLNMGMFYDYFMNTHERISLRLLVNMPSKFVRWNFLGIYIWTTGSLFVYEV